MSTYQQKSWRRAGLVDYKMLWFKKHPVSCFLSCALLWKQVFNNKYYRSIYCACILFVSVTSCYEMKKIIRTKMCCTWKPKGFHHVAFPHHHQQQILHQFQWHHMEQIGYLNCFSLLSQPVVKKKWHGI